MCRLAADWGYAAWRIASLGDHLEVDKHCRPTPLVDGRRCSAGQGQVPDLKVGPSQTIGRGGMRTTRSTSGTPRHPAGADLGRRRARGGTAARREEHEGHRPGRGQAGRQRRSSLHRTRAIWKASRCFPGCRNRLIGRRLHDFARPLDGTDPGRVRRGRRPSFAHEVAPEGEAKSPTTMTTSAR